MSGFNDIIGNDAIKNHFRKACEAGKISHAYIIEGERGMGKKMLANAFAMTMLCEQGGSDACGECHSCRQFLSGNHPDMCYVTHEKPNSIGVDDVREQITNTIDIKPYNGRHKVYLVDEAEKMTVQAQNALLKTIEEPPAYAHIMLLTENTESFLPTIKSRCIKLAIRPLPANEIKAYLVSKYGMTESKASVLTAFANGNLGKAEKISSSDEFMDFYRETLNLLKNVKKMDISVLVDSIKKIQEENNNLQEILDVCLLWYRDVLMFKVTKDINSMMFKDEYGVISSICSQSTYEGLEMIVTAIEKAKTRLKANVNTDLTLELMFLTMKEN